MVQFNSVFKKEFIDLIELKRSMGFKYCSEEASFKRIDNFFCEENLSNKVITKSLTDKWNAKRDWENDCNRNSRVSNLRVFSNYLLDLGYEVYVTPINSFKKGPKYNAHIYSQDELKRFFKAVDESKSVLSECPYRDIVMPVFFRILYTSGLRVSELRLLKLKDMHEDKSYITIIDGKNHKDRIVPINDELAARCKVIRNSIHSNSDENEYFFKIRDGECMTLQNVYDNFRRYLDKAHISHTGKGPRVHDFRHTYCINLLRKWFLEGKDLLNYLPYMKTMLGHETFDETAYYLKLTKEIFPDITLRLETTYSKFIETVEVNDDEEYY